MPAHKLVSRLGADRLVTYTFQAGDVSVDMNPLIGHHIRIAQTQEMTCVGCGRAITKTFQQGYCFPCTRSLAACDICIVRPEKCHYHHGTCREPNWADDHCMQQHIVYLANTSKLKVGITRHTQIPTRWIDQGATQALPLYATSNRHAAGLVEVALKAAFSDKTDWRAMLKGIPTELDLLTTRTQIHQTYQSAIDDIIAAHDALTIEPLQTEETHITFPVQQYPVKVSSLNLDKTPEITGVLNGIKGQYLILDCGVLNIRKYTGYHLQITPSE